MSETIKKNNKLKGLFKKTKKGYTRCDKNK